jgi:YVTN family beta-propeller protein
MKRILALGVAVVLFGASEARATPSASIKREVPLHVQTVYVKNTPIPNVGINPTGMAFDGLRMWVANYDSNTLQRYDIESNAQIGSAITLASGANPSGVAFDGTNIWVVCENARAYKYNTSGTLLATINLSGAAKGIVFDGDYMWVATAGGSGSLDRIRVSTSAVTTFSTGIMGGASVAFDGRNVWVTNASNGTSKIDGLSGALLFSSNTLIGPSSTAGVAFDGRYIWISGETALKKVDPATNTVIATVTTYADPRGIAFDGRHLWVACWSADTIMIVDVKTNQVYDTIQLATGTHPYNPVFDGAHMWVDAQLDTASPGTIYKFLARYY